MLMFKHYRNTLRTFLRYFKLIQFHAIFPCHILMSIYQQVLSQLPPGMNLELMGQGPAPPPGQELPKVSTV